jgi:hypothetical protein
MSEAVYDTTEGEFVDFDTLEEWATIDKSKDARIKELEAKLAKAVERLDKIQRGYYGRAAAIARTTLAELTGGKDG